MAKFVDLSGQRFGRLVAIRRGEDHASPSRSQVTWECVCDCGEIVTVQRGGLRSGLSTSCGCSYKDLGKKKRTSRFKNQAEYASWSHMKQRCTNPIDKDFPNYGGRGISVCDEWIDSFDQFFLDMGKRPTDMHSLDRIDTNGNYEPSNCRWATPTEQSRNRRHTKYFNQENGSNNNGT